MATTTNTTIDVNVADLAKQVTDLLTSTAEGAADAHVARRLDEARAKHTLDGVLVAPDAAFQRLEDEYRIAYDEDLATRWSAIDRDLKVAQLTVQQAIADAERPPKETDPLLYELRTMNARARFAGRTLRELVTAYETTADADHPTLIDLIERDRDGFQLKSDEADASESLRLKQLIEARRSARVPNELRETLKQIGTLAGGATLRTFVYHAHQGQLHVATVRKAEQREAMNARREQRRFAAR